MPPFSAEKIITPKSTIAECRYLLPFFFISNFFSSFLILLFQNCSEVIYAVGSRKESVQNAQNISFSLEQKDSLLQISPAITLRADEKFRNQRIRLLLKVPEGKSVHFSFELEDILRQAKNENGKSTDEMLGHTWVMGKKKLECSDCGN